MTPRAHGGAAPPPPASSSSGSSSSGIDRSDEHSSREHAVHPPPKAAAGKWALPDLERNSRCAGGAKGEGGAYPKNAVQTCGGGRGESGVGNDDSRREPRGDGERGKDETTDDDARESGRDGDKEKGDSGERQGDGRGGDGGEEGGGESGDDGDRTGNNGVGAGEVDEDDDGEEEAEERGADEETDTFLRLSEVDFIEGIDVLQLGGTSTAARDSSIGGPCGGGGGGGGDEDVRVISRHLSDFFRSPLAPDPTPKHRSPSRRSLSDVQTGARLFGSAKSPGSDDDGAFSIGGSGNVYDPAFSGAVGGTSAEVDATRVVINCVGSPPPSVSPAAGGAVGIPDTAVATFSSDETEQAQTADIDELAAKTNHLCEALVAGVNDGPCEPEGTEVAQEEGAQADCGLRHESVGDGGDGESEEEWLSGDVGAPARENWGDNSRSPNVTATSATTQEAEPKADKTAAIVGTHWAGLNDDGSWRTEVARKAAGKAGEVEAERRRLAKIIADESWRSDAGEADGTGCRSRRNVRRDSVIRLQSGNVRYT